MINDLDWKQPALIGGLIVGIASAVPGISVINCCFCGWALIGGAVASKMLISDAPRPVRSSDGAMLGLYAGLIGAIVFFLIAVPIIMSGFATKLSASLMESIAGNFSNPELQAAMTEAVAEMSEQGPLERLRSSIVVLIFQAILQTGFTVLGSLLGVSLFEKRIALPPPPPYLGDQQ